MSDDARDVWEFQRRSSLRTFLVYLYDVDEPELVTGHFWSNENYAGHYNFYTVEPSGRKTIRDSFGVTAVLRVREISEDSTDAAMAEFTKPIATEDKKTILGVPPVKKTYDVH